MMVGIHTILTGIGCCLWIKKKKYKQKNSIDSWQDLTEEQENDFLSTIKETKKSVFTKAFKIYKLEKTGNALLPSISEKYNTGITFVHEDWFRTEFTYRKIKQNLRIDHDVPKNERVPI